MNTLSINNILEQSKSLELNANKQVGIFTNELSNATLKTIGSVANYLIKGMPVVDSVKDVLVDIKNSIVKGQDFKSIIGTAVKSSVREGLEYLGFSTKNISSIMSLKDIAQKGGLAFAIKTALQVVAKNYLKNNIAGNFVCNFFEKLYAYVQNSSFMEKLTQFIKKTEKKKDDFMNKVKQWYEAYDKKDIKAITTIADKLQANKQVLEKYLDCAKENSLIQTLSKRIVDTKQNISQEQLQLCRVM